MPQRALHPCRAPGCPALTSGGYCAEHQPQIKREDVRPSASERGYDANWERTRIRIMARDPVCRDWFGDHARRGEVVPTTDIDHIVPKRRGGTDTDDNLQGLCHRCHSRKTRAGL